MYIYTPAGNTHMCVRNTCIHVCTHTHVHTDTNVCKMEMDNNDDKGEKKKGNSIARTHRDCSLDCTTQSTPSKTIRRSHIYIHMYIYIYTYTYIHIYIYIDIRIY